MNGLHIHHLLKDLKMLPFFIIDALKLDLLKNVENSTIVKLNDLSRNSSAKPFLQVSVSEFLMPIQFRLFCPLLQWSRNTKLELYIGV